MPLTIVLLRLIERLEESSDETNACRCHEKMGRQRIVQSANKPSRLASMPRNVYEAWTFYKSHLHANHPEFESWNKRASWIYLVPIALIILPLVVGVGQLVPPNVTPLVFELSWVSMIGTLVAVFAIKSSGKRRFRRLWNEQHGGTVTPL